MFSFLLREDIFVNLLFMLFCCARMANIQFRFIIILYVTMCIIFTSVFFVAYVRDIPSDTTVCYYYYIS